MKTLEHHTIIYDDECPMCNLYTSAFVKSGMLDENGRQAFSHFAKGPSPRVDLERAANEIALINQKDGSVTYGLSSLLKIIGNSFPVFKPLFKLRLFRLIMEQVYFFVSYNRKVIVPGNNFEQQNACTPTYHKAYRTAYIIIAWFLTAVILNQYSHSLTPVVPHTSFYREFLICGGQIIFQGIVVSLIMKERLLHYLGNLMTISLGGALLLLPMMLLSGFVNAPYPFILYFLLVAFLMLLEHIRRVKILELPWYVSVGWVAYRVLVLFIII